MVTLLSRFFLTFFIMLYLAVSQLHPLMHWDSVPDGLERSAVMQLDDTSGSAAQQTWCNRLNNRCPGDFSNHKQKHHSCNCSMLQFTVQQKFESSILLTVNELAFSPLDRIDTQYFPRGLNPPPRLS